MIDCPVCRSKWHTFVGWMAHQAVHELDLRYRVGLESNPETGHEEYPDLRKLRDDVLIILEE